MSALRSDDRSEPIYLCEEHAKELEYHTDPLANAIDLSRRGSKTKESELSASVGSRPARSPSAVWLDKNVTAKAQQGRRQRYVFPLSIGFILVGILVGLKLFRAIPRVPQIPERSPAIGLDQQASSALPQKEKAKRLAQSPVTLDINTSPRLRNTQVADVPVGGGVARTVLPNLPQSARDTIQGTLMVIVRVNVDPEGNVIHTEVEYSGPSKYFLRLALEAAERWKFRPPTLDGQNVASKWTLRFEFTRNETRAIPTRSKH